VILREPANALDPRVRAVWTAEGVLATVALALLTAMTTALTAAAGSSTAAWLVGLVGGALVLLAAVGAIVRPRVDYRRYRYEVTELGLYVAHGWLWQRWQVIPHARVQTVDTKAGVLLRAFGLVSVEVTTASAAGGTSIPGLRPPVADSLVEELARHAGIEEGT
jgi:membrane protein YdbS with pleckstrin-like domain